MKLLCRVPLDLILNQSPRRRRATWPAHPCTRLASPGDSDGGRRSHERGGSSPAPSRSPSMGPTTGFPAFTVATAPPILPIRFNRAISLLAWSICMTSVAASFRDTRGVNPFSLAMTFTTWPTVVLLQQRSFRVLPAAGVGVGRGRRAHARSCEAWRGWSESDHFGACQTSARAVVPPPRLRACPPVPDAGDA